MSEIKVNGIDKFYHISVGFGATFILALLLLIGEIPSIISIPIIFLGLVGKEIYDMNKANATGFSIKDIIANTLGIILGYLTFIMVISG